MQQTTIHMEGQNKKAGSRDSERHVRMITYINHAGSTHSIFAVVEFVGSTHVVPPRVELTPLTHPLGQGAVWTEQHSLRLASSEIRQNSRRYTATKTADQSHW